MKSPTIAQREALERYLARKFPAADYREVTGNAMLAGVVVMVAVGAACLLVFGGAR